LHALAEIFNADMLTAVAETDRAAATRVLTQVRKNLLQREAQAKAS